MINLKKLSFLAAFAAMAMSMTAETMTLGGKEYEFERLIERKIGPGTTYLRLRFPDYPLNVNMVMVDLNNPYNQIETTIANESAKGTESLVKAAQRQTTANHVPLAAANANFWYTEAKYTLYYNIVKGGSIRNGKMVTEYNVNSEKWDGGPTRTGIVGISDDRTAYVDYCEPSASWVYNNNTKVVHTCNKGFRTKQYGIYNSFYGRDRQFMPYAPDASNDNKYTLNTGVTDGLELYFKMDEGQDWIGGKDLTFTCTGRKTGTDARGKLGDNDLAIIGFGGLAAKTDVGEKITLKYNFKFQDGATPNLVQGLCGNALVMRHGELTEHNSNEEYNSMVYSRTGYGCSQDGKTVYMIVIDKSTDPTYGKSAGCNTAKMCEIARHFGCYNMSNFDAGGSAEMMVDNAVINKTTETTPRNVANGWMVFSTAPDNDKTLASLAFDHPTIDVVANGSFTPTILGYNKEDALIEKNVTDFTLSCSPELGTCNGKTFVAGSNPATGTLTATARGISVSKTITVGGGAGVKDLAINDTQVYAPCKVNMGEEFPVSSTGVGMKSIALYDMNGTLVSSAMPNDTEAMLTAPSFKGIYILNIVRTDGLRTSRKLIVL